MSAVHAQGSRLGALRRHAVRSRIVRSQQPRRQLATPAAAAAAAAPRTDVIFSGIQPTGIPHLGNYLGALRQWVHLQATAPPSTKLIFSVVDLHALTARQEREQLRQRTKETLATLLAVGLDPERCVIFVQSHVPAHVELMWILSCTASSMGYLSRMTQWKSKMALPDSASLMDSGAKKKLKLGLFSYPVLQAADVLVHGTTHVPVGEDQIQHIEFARECARNFNGAYGEKLLVEPQVLLSPAKRVMSLKEPQLKMSKSHDDPRSRILVTDPPEEIRRKVMAALTDSRDGISYDPASRPGVSNLLEIMSHLEGGGATPEQLARDLDGAGLSMRALKEGVAERLSRSLGGIREAYHGIMGEKGEGPFFADVAAAGAGAARESAARTMRRVYDAVGL